MLFIDLKRPALRPFTIPAQGLGGRDSFIPAGERIQFTIPSNQCQDKIGMATTLRYVCECGDLAERVSEHGLTF